MPTWAEAAGLLSAMKKPGFAASRSLNLLKF
jgi:hypothetical protein